MSVWEPATEAPPSFGVLLRRYRARARISQEELAEHARLSPETISALERGARRSPYRDTVAVLASALGLSPVEYTLLEAAAGRSSAPTAMRASLQPVSGPSGNLPLQLTSFVGRSDQVDAIDTLIRKNRLVTLTGSGGVGKTRTALQVAGRLGDRMADGTWFVELAALVDPTLVPSAIAGALRCGLPNDDDTLQSLLTMLARKQLLLVLDNCEHLVEAASTVARALLLECPQVTLLVTSRRALQIAGEVTFQVPSLLVPDALTVADLTMSAAKDFEAVTLFVDRARAAESRFALTANNASLVAEICRRLDGIPLAIELAATRIRILSPRDLRDRLDERFRLLTGGSRDALPRQQTLRALIDWSYELLDECERELFRRAGIFADGFTLEAASAVCGDASSGELDVLDLLASLVDKSLILAAVAGDVRRFRLLESTRIYALEMLAASGELPEIEARHARYFYAAVTRAAQALEIDGSDSQFAVLGRDLENVRSALRHSATLGVAGDGGNLAVAAARLFGRLGLGVEGVRWLEAALGNADPADLRLQSRLWGAIGYLIGNTGGARSLNASERAVALARSAGDDELTAWALTQYATAAMDKLRRDDAEQALSEAEQLFGPDPLPNQRARILSIRGYIARLVGDHPASLAINRELRSVYRRLGNESGELRATLNYAESLHAFGKTASAIAVVGEVSDREVADRETHGLLAANLAAYHAAAGDAEAAFASGRRAIELLAAGRGTGAVATAIGHLALAHALRGDAKRAALLLGYWDASSDALGVTREFTERTTYEQLVILLGQRLSAGERETVRKAGAVLSPQDAIAEALR